MPRLRLLTWNLWHALNPYARVLMRPMESPLAHLRRRAGQFEALSRWCASPGDVLCLQEVNPVRKQVGRLRRKLGLRGEGCIANTGLKLGRLGIPPLLQEGPATLVAEGFTELGFREFTLSAAAWETRLSSELDLTLQWAERRKALIFEGTLDGRRVGIVNLHAHHGPDSIPENFRRKRGELERLRDELRPRIGEWEIAAVCGDFNCDAESEVMAPLLELGFRDSAELAGLDSIPPTWDARENPLAARSPELADSDEARAWDLAPHVFDRVYLRFKDPDGAAPKVSYAQIREPALSDHFAVSVEISWR